jgi:hypothetical protein
MKRLLVACSAVAVAAVLGAPEARAWSQEPVGGGSGGEARFASPPAGSDTSGTPGAAVSGSDNDAFSPFSLGVSRSDAPYSRLGRSGYRRLDPPKALHPDSEHLYWGNTSTR